MDGEEKERTKHRIHRFVRVYSQGYNTSLYSCMAKINDIYIEWESHIAKKNFFHSSCYGIQKIQQQQKVDYYTPDGATNTGRLQERETVCDAEKELSYSPFDRVITKHKRTPSKLSKTNATANVLQQQQQQ